VAPVQAKTSTVTLRLPSIAMSATGVADVANMTKIAE